MEDEEMKAAIEAAQTDLGRVVREYRNHLDLTQAALAGRMVSLGHDSWRQTTVAKVEASGRPLSLAEATSLCYILGLPRIEALYDGSNVGALLAQRHGEELRSRMGRALEATFSYMSKIGVPAPELEEVRQHMARVQEVVYSTGDDAELAEAEEAVNHLTETLARRLGEHSHAERGDE